MENIKQKIQADLTQTIKKGDEIGRSTLRMLLATILSKEKEKRYKAFKEKPDLSEEELAEKSILTDEEIIEVIFSEVKKRKEAIESFSAHGGLASGEKKDKIENAINKEKAELKVLQTYLPEQLSEEEIKKIVKEAIEKTKAKEIKDMGKVMAEIMPKVKGKTDGGMVSKIVKELLFPKKE